jgi:hypothetical protein
MPEKICEEGPVGTMTYEETGFNIRHSFPMLLYLSLATVIHSRARARARASEGSYSSSSSSVCLTIKFYGVWYGLSQFVNSHFVARHYACED